jgi:hypothetical protein
MDKNECNEDLDVRKASVYLGQDLSEKKFNDFRLHANFNIKRSKIYLQN